MLSRDGGAELFSLAIVEKPNGSLGCAIYGQICAPGAQIAESHHDDRSLNQLRDEPEVEKRQGALDRRRRAQDVFQEAPELFAPVLKGRIFAQADQGLKNGCLELRPVLVLFQLRGQSIPSRISPYAQSLCAFEKDRVDDEAELGWPRLLCRRR